MTYVLRVSEGPARGTQAVVDRRFVVGRGGADVNLGDPAVSRSHLAVEPDSSGVVATDLGSSSGTFVDDTAVRSARLAPGAVITVGRTRLVLLALRPVEDAAIAGDLTLVGPDGSRHAVTASRPVRLGRGRSDNDVVVDDSSVSRRHCEVRVDGDSVIVTDLRSSNGTFVNGERISTPRRVQAGDHIRLALDGPTFVFERTSAAPTEADTRRSLRVRIEGEQRLWAVDVECPGDTATHEVADALAAYLGATGAEIVLYRSSDGLLLDPEARWSKMPLQRGDELVLAPCTAPMPAATGRPLVPASHRVAVNQRPRATWPPATFEPILPSVPEGTSLRGRGLIWQVTGGGVAVVGGLTVALLRTDPLFRIFGLVFAAVGVVTMLASILGDQSRRRFRQHQFTERLTDLNRQLYDARVSQLAQLHEASPPIGELRSWPSEGSSRLWERRPGDEDFLAARVGRGRIAALIRFEEGYRRSESPLAGSIGELVERHRYLDDAPIVLPGLEAPVVSLWGDPIAAEELAHSIVLQAALLHSPQDLGIAVLAADDRWSWLRWLPHVEGTDQLELTSDLESAGGLAAHLASVIGDKDSPDQRARLIVMTPAVAASPSGRALLAASTQGRAQALVVCTNQREVPSETTVEIECDRKRARLRGVVLPGATAGVAEIEVEGLDRAAAMRVVDDLAPLEDPRHATRRSAPTVDLLGLLGLDATTARDPSPLWAHPPSPLLTVPIGQDEHGAPVTVGLRRDGPHGLIAGTTGSGKSVLLQSLLTALALTHPPERLNFFLVDFKGGATFKESGLAELPHTVGLVTDLEGQKSLTARAFRALNAEIARRKELASAARVENILQYEKLDDPTLEPMPNLLVVIDEFALLAKEQPEVREELGVVAAQGRSLGVHLLLAMQSPQGVVSAEIKKNTNLWICLRVVQTDESVAVLDRPDAALLPADEPGRGYIRLGASAQLTGFRAAQLSSASDTTPRVLVSPFLDERPPMSAQAPRAAFSADALTTRDLCAAIRDTAIRNGPAPQRSLWLPPLPATLSVEQLGDATAPAPDELRVRLGLGDHPEQQEQRAAWIDLGRSANLLIVGEFGAGKSTALSHIALDLAERHSPADVHLYAIDSGVGALNTLGALPHTGAVVGADDAERLVRLLAMLSAEVSSRRARLADAGADWRSVRRSGGDDAPPWIVLFVDDYAVLREHAEELGNARVLEQLQSLAQIGPSVGVHVVLAAAQRLDIRLTFQNLFANRFALRMSDPGDYEIVSLRQSSARDLELPPGRGVIEGGVHVQVPSVDPERARRAAERWSATPTHRLPRRVERLPDAVDLGAVLAARPPGGDEIVLGIGGDTILEPVVLDTERFGPVLLVLGEDRSGRSSTLVTWRAAALAANPNARFALLTPRRSPLRLYAEDPHTIGIASDEAEMLALLDEVAEQPTGAHVLVDDAESISSRVGTALEVLLRNARDLDVAVVLAARAADFLRVYDGWARYLLSLKSALLLMPTPDVASALDVRLPRQVTTPRPGRAYLVERGRLTTLQVAEAV